MLAPCNVVGLAIGYSETRAVAVPRKAYYLVVVVQPLYVPRVTFRRFGFIIAPITEIVSSWLLHFSGTQLVQCLLDSFVGFAEVKVGTKRVHFFDVFPLFLPSDLIRIESALAKVGVQKRDYFGAQVLQPGAQSLHVDRAECLCHGCLAFLLTVIVFVF